MKALGKLPGAWLAEGHTLKRLQGPCQTHGPLLFLQCVPEGLRHPCRALCHSSLSASVLSLPASDRWPGSAEEGTPRGPGWDSIPRGRV